MDEKRRTKILLLGGGFAQKQLVARGVELRTNTKVEAVTDRDVTLSDGSRIVTSTLVCSARAARGKCPASERGRDDKRACSSLLRTIPPRMTEVML